MLARLLQSDALEPEPLSLTLEESKPGVLPLLEELRRQCDLGQLNQAEDRLFAEVDFSDPATLPTVLGFYQYLNHYTDRQLESWDYSRKRSSTACGTAPSATAPTPSWQRLSAPDGRKEAYDQSLFFDVDGNLAGPQPSGRQPHAGIHPALPPPGGGKRPPLLCGQRPHPQLGHLLGDLYPFDGYLSVNGQYAVDRSARSCTSPPTARRTSSSWWSWSGRTPSPA